MPRLSPTLIRQASSYSPLLPLLLRECRDLSSARNELRWLKEHVLSDTRQSTTPQRRKRLIDCVNRRSHGEPLQYILGTQPFGDLEILCRKQVLIPRPETEVYATSVGQLILDLYKAEIIDRSRALSIADLCSGSGCISLLLHSLLVPPSYDKRQFHNAETGSESDTRPHDVQVHGFDISPHALDLSNENLSHGIATETLHETAATAVSFRHLDVLTLARNLSASNNDRPGSVSTGSKLPNHKWDIIVSNPPYISPSDFAPGGTTTRSVREYEPRLALVPPELLSQDLIQVASVATVVPSRMAPDLAGRHLLDVEQADQFYHAILHIAHHIGTKVVVMEIGDSKQAGRVRAITSTIFRGEDVLLETWLDDGSHIRYNLDTLAVERQQNQSQAHERAVVVWRGEYASWRKSSL